MKDEEKLFGTHRLTLTVAEECGTRLRNLRELRGWSQKELAARLGFGDGVISRYENGRFTPRVNHLIRIADVLGVSLDELVGRGVRGQRTEDRDQTDIRPLISDL